MSFPGKSKSNSLLGEQEVIRILALSDLHAFDSGRKGRKGTAPPSYVDVSKTGQGATELPLRALEDSINTEAIRVDALVCCGDLGDGADPVGIKFAWEFLNALRAKLSASVLVTAVGNHDLDSRFLQKSYDTKEFIQNLTPTFPGDTQTLSNQFWAQHFVLYKRDLFRVLLLDSCAYHGIKKEHVHGRISQVTLGVIDRMLSADGPCALNLLVVHHHPQKQTEYNLGEYDDMKNGQQLLDLLGSGKHGDWIVIHGHKHCPKISYAAGGTTSPLVFSCGSIGAQLYPELGANVRNQWYLLELPVHLFPHYGLVGTFKAWDWIPTIGYQKARATSGLPCQGGFGNRTPLAMIAQSIRSLFTSPSRLDWLTICSRRPDLQFILPRDLRRLADLLAQHHKINTQFSELGLIEEMERVA